MNELDKKLHILISWLFRDIAVNVYSNSKRWTVRDTGQPLSKTVSGVRILLGESNLGSIQLMCVAIETLGRVWLGKKDDVGVSSQCFTEFIRVFFPARYYDLRNEIYNRYRCGLLHSHILGFKNSFYPNRKLRNSDARHLYFASVNNNSFNPRPGPEYPRMVVDVDIFYQDLCSATTKLYEKIINGGEHNSEAARSLEDIY
ncbi:MAG: hypothetical protein WC844_00155 [Patescibacteria group bacterium]